MRAFIILRKKMSGFPFSYPTGYSYVMPPLVHDSEIEESNNSFSSFRYTPVGSFTQESLPVFNSVSNQQKVQAETAKQKNAAEERKQKEWEIYQMMAQKEKEERQKLKEEREKKNAALMKQHQTSIESSFDRPKSLIPKPVENPLEDIGVCTNCSRLSNVITNRDDYAVCSCSNKCKLMFHKKCWLDFFRENRNDDKKSVNCPTEACGGYIARVQQHEKDALVQTLTINPPINHSKPQKKSELFKSEEPVSSQHKHLKHKPKKESPIVDVKEPVVKTLPLKEREDATLKVSLSTGRLEKSYYLKQLADNALKHKEKKIYKMEKYSLRVGFEVGIVVALTKTNSKIMTSSIYVDGEPTGLKVGDMVQFPRVKNSATFLTNIEVLERPEHIPDNFQTYLATLQKQLHEINVKYDPIPFKIKPKKKKISPPKRDNKAPMTQDIETTLTTNIVNPEEVVSREGLKPLEYSYFSGDLKKYRNLWIGTVTNKGEYIYGRLNVDFAPKGATILIPKDVFFHQISLSKDSPVPVNGDRVVFEYTMIDGVLRTVNVHVISEACYGRLLIELPKIQ